MPFAGFTHEHNRDDRLEYVVINEKNIGNQSLYNFEQKESVNYGPMSTPYDFRYQS